jgi:hypothetical protein
MSAISAARKTVVAHRVTRISITLDDDEVKRAIVGYVLQELGDEVPKGKIDVVANLSDRTGEAEIDITVTEDL